MGKPLDSADITIPVLMVSNTTGDNMKELLALDYREGGQTQITIQTVSSLKYKHSFVF